LELKKLREAQAKVEEMVKEMEKELEEKTAEANKLKAG
jgi:hypothetical protein